MNLSIWVAKELKRPCPSNRWFQTARRTAGRFRASFCPQKNDMSSLRIRKRLQKLICSPVFQLYLLSSLQKGGSSDRRRNESSRYWPQDGIRERDEALSALSFYCDEDFSRIDHVYASVSCVSWRSELAHDYARSDKWKIHSSRSSKVR